jgi:hypothetical protein
MHMLKVLSIIMFFSLNFSFLAIYFYLKNFYSIKYVLLEFFHLVRTLKHTLNCKKFVKSQTHCSTVPHLAYCFCGGNVSLIGDRRKQ